MSTESRRHHFCYCIRKLVFTLQTAIMTADFTWFLNFVDVELVLNVIKCPVYLQSLETEQREDLRSE